MLIGALAIKHYQKYCTYVRKYLSGRILASFSPDIHKYSESTEYLTLNQPNVSLPSTSSVEISQNFTPSKFSHICMVLIC